MLSHGVKTPLRSCCLYFLSELLTFKKTQNKTKQKQTKTKFKAQQKNKKWTADTHTKSKVPGYMLSSTD